MRIISNKSRNIVLVIVAALSFMLFGGASSSGCDAENTADVKQSEAQEQLQSELVAQVGLPSIHNFREARVLKEILEQRDTGFATYAYTFIPMTGKFLFLGHSVGYPIPAATQFTNPQKIQRVSGYSEWLPLPQADPNGLFSPASAEGTYLLMDFDGKGAKAQYFEERIDCTCSPLPDGIVANASMQHDK